MCPSCHVIFQIDYPEKSANEMKNIDAVVCPNCANRIRVKKTDETNSIQAGISPTPEIDSMWIEYGKKLITSNIEGLNDRARFMITTCASLIVIQFGLSLAFKIQPFSFKLTPQFFLVISAALFAKSLYRIGSAKYFNLQSTDSIKDYYQNSTTSIYIWHVLGLLFFIAGLLAIAIMTLIQ